MTHKTVITRSGPVKKVIVTRRARLVVKGSGIQGAPHAHDGLDGSGIVAHANITGLAPDDHHAESHAHDGADGSGAVAHADTGAQTPDDHHAESHAARHEPAGADELSFLRSGLAPVTSARALNAEFALSSTRPTWVSYTVRITLPLSVVGGRAGMVELLSDAASPPTVVRAQTRFEASADVARSIEVPLSYLVPAGHNVLLRTTVISGAPTFQLNAQVEVAL